MSKYEITQSTTFPWMPTFTAQDNNMFWKRHSLLFFISYSFGVPCLAYRLILGHSEAQNSCYLMFNELEMPKFDLVNCHFQNYVHQALGIFFTRVNGFRSSYEFGPPKCTRITG